MRRCGKSYNAVPTNQHNQGYNQGYEPSSSSSSGLALMENQQSYQILVVESDADVYALCHKVLPYDDFVVQYVKPHRQVAEQFQHQAFDLVLIGLHAPTEESLFILKQIRHYAIDIPIVAIVERIGPETESEKAAERLEHISQVVRLGVQGLLFKPLCPTQLHATIVEVLQKHLRDTYYRWHTMQQVVQTEKLATVERLVTSIAHEMNNPLQALLNSHQLMSNRDLQHNKRQQYQTLARREVDKLIGVVHRMLEFYRPAAEGMRPLNLNTLLEGVLRLVDRRLRKNNIEVRRDWYPALPLVFAIGGRLKQVCLDLISNAIDSMPNGGVLTIRTYTTSQPAYHFNAGLSWKPATSSAGYLRHGPTVVVEISDTGHGIPSDDLPKVFEPFYTTRTNAAGLGLALTYSIVEQHQGELSVSSTEGQGTTIRVQLPAATFKPASN